MRLNYVNLPDLWLTEIALTAGNSGGQRGRCHARLVYRAAWLLPWL
jgi:hypothetical protein